MNLKGSVVTPAEAYWPHTRRIERRTDLEIETIEDVRKILKEEFEKE